MRNKLQLFGFLISSALLSASAVAQEAAPKEKAKFNTWSVTPSFGPTLIYGDTRVYDFFPVKNNYVNERKFGFGFSVNKQINDKFAVHGNLIKGKLSGAKLNINPDSGKREYTWKGSTISETDFFEYTLLASVNLTGMIFKTANWTKTFSVNAYTGLGLVNFRSIRRQITDQDNIIASVGYENPTDKTKKEATTEAVVPVGFMLNYKINKNFDIGLDLSMRNVNSDKLDAINKPETSKDLYSYTALAVTYRFGKNEKDLKWLDPEEKLIAEGVKPDMSKYDNAISDMNKKLDEINQKNEELNQKVDELNRKNDELNKKLDEKVKSIEESNSTTGTVRAPKTTKADGSTETNVTDFFSIEFELNSAVLKKDSYKDLKLLSEVLTQNPKCELKVDGHTDVSGSSAINFKLSQQRANAVRDYLIKAGVPNAVRIKTEAWGEKKPVSSNDTEEGRAKNRRVELNVRCND